MEVTEIVTKTGFECEVDSEAVDDMEFFEKLAEMTESDAKAVINMPKIVRALIGEEQKKALYDHCRNAAGRVPVKAVEDEIGDIMNGLSESKKKS